MPLPLGCPAFDQPDDASVVHRAKYQFDDVKASGYRV
jgi:hypothetical protein